MSFEWNTTERFDAIDKSIKAVSLKIDALSAQIAALKQLSPADQARLNTIFDTAIGDSATIATAISPAQKAPNG